MGHPRTRYLYATKGPGRLNKPTTLLPVEISQWFTDSTNKSASGGGLPVCRARTAPAVQWLLQDRAGNMCSSCWLQCMLAKPSCALVPYALQPLSLLSNLPPFHPAIIAVQASWSANGLRFPYGTIAAAQVDGYRNRFDGPLRVLPNRQAQGRFQKFGQTNCCVNSLGRWARW